MSVVETICGTCESGAAFAGGIIIGAMLGLLCCWVGWLLRDDAR